MEAGNRNCRFSIADCLRAAATGGFRRTFALRTPHFFGFTLIELLVVVAIISILMAVLMPTLNRARELVRSAVCKSNEKAVGLAFSMYAAAWNDQIVPVGSAYFETANINSFVNPSTTWYHLFGWMNLLGSRERFRGNIFGMYNNRYAVTRCPAEGAPIIPANNVSSIYSGRTIIYYDSELQAGSYVMNNSVCFGYYGPYWSGGVNCYRPGWSQGSPYYPSSAAMIVTDTSDAGVGWKLAFYEPCIDYYPSQYYTGYGYYYTFRHSDQTGNFLFMDGHVEPKKHHLDTGQNLYQALWHENPPSRR